MKNINLYISVLALSAQMLFGAAGGKNLIDISGQPRPKGSLSQKQLNFGESLRAEQNGLRTSLTINNLESDKIVAVTSVLDRDKDGKLMLQLATVNCPIDEPNFKVEWRREWKSVSALGEEGFVTSVNNLPSRCDVSSGAITIPEEQNYYEKNELNEIAKALQLLRLNLMKQSNK